MPPEDNASVEDQVRELVRVTVQGIFDEFDSAEYRELVHRYITLLTREKVKALNEVDPAKKQEYQKNVKHLVAAMRSEAAAAYIKTQKTAYDQFLRFVDVLLTILIRASFALVAG